MGSISQRFENRWCLVLFPFAAFIAAVPFVVLFTGILGLFDETRVASYHRAEHVSMVLKPGCVICVVALLLGATFSERFVQRRVTRSVLLLAVLGLLWSILLHQR